MDALSHHFRAQYHWWLDLFGTIAAIVLLTYGQWHWAAYAWLLTEVWRLNRNQNLILMELKK